MREIITGTTSLALSVWAGYTYVFHGLFVLLVCAVTLLVLALNDFTRAYKARAQK
jgi:uncharacterized membrane protein